VDSVEREDVRLDLCCALCAGTEWVLEGYSILLLAEYTLGWVIWDFVEILLDILCSSVTMSSGRAYNRRKTRDTEGGGHGRPARSVSRQRRQVNLDFTIPSLVHDPGYQTNTDCVGLGVFYSLYLW
jgi:hypothetical protein